MLRLYRITFVDVDKVTNQEKLSNNLIEKYVHVILDTLAKHLHGNQIGIKLR